MYGLVIVKAVNYLSLASIVTTRGNCESVQGLVCCHLLPHSSWIIGEKKDNKCCRKTILQMKKTTGLFRTRKNNFRFTLMTVGKPRWLLDMFMVLWLHFLSLCFVSYLKISGNLILIIIICCRTSRTKLKVDWTSQLK